MLLGRNWTMQRQATGHKTSEANLRCRRPRRYSGECVLVSLALFIVVCLLRRNSWRFPLPPLLPPLPSTLNGVTWDICLQRRHEAMAQHPPVLHAQRYCWLHWIQNPASVKCPAIRIILPRPLFLAFDVKCKATTIHPNIAPYSHIQTHTHNSPALACSRWLEDEKNVTVVILYLRIVIYIYTSIHIFFHFSIFAEEYRKLVDKIGKPSINRDDQQWDK